MQSHETVSPRSGSPSHEVAGHDQWLQILDGRRTDYALVSGLGSSTKATDVGHRDDTLFAHEHPNFMALDITNEMIWLSVGETETVVTPLPLRRQLH